MVYPVSKIFGYRGKLASALSTVVLCVKRTRGVDVKWLRRNLTNLD